MYNKARYFEEYFDKFVSAGRDLLRIESVQSEAKEGAPFGAGVRETLSCALKISEELGLKIKDGDGYYGYAETGDGELFGILGHLDTVPPGDGWSVPPLGGDIIDGVLYGRGALDDKLPILACAFATAELIREGFTPNKRIRIIYGCNEESGWKCIDKYLENEEIPSLAFSPDGDFPVINCERGAVYHTVTLDKPDYISRLTGGNRPNMVMDSASLKMAEEDAELIAIAKNMGIEYSDGAFIATGKSAHGSTPYNGDNALWKILALLSARYGGEWRRLYDIIACTDGSGYGLAIADKSGALTVNVGTVNSDSSSITLAIDIRFPVSYTKEYITEKLKAVFGSSKVEQGAYHNPLYISPDHTLCSRLLEAYESITGEKAKPISIGGATYARAFPTAVAFGPIFPEEEATIHQKDERVSLDNLKRMYKIYREAIRRLCFD